MLLELEEGDAELLQEALSLLSKLDGSRDDDLRRQQQLQYLLLRVNEELERQHLDFEAPREFTEEQSQTLGMLVAVVRDGDDCLLLDAYGPAWEIACEGDCQFELMEGELRPEEQGVWIAVGDLHYRACGSYECPEEDFEVTFHGTWRKPTEEEWERWHHLDGFDWSIDDLPRRGG